MRELVDDGTTREMRAKADISNVLETVR